MRIQATGEPALIGTALLCLAGAALAQSSPWRYAVLTVGNELNPSAGATDLNNFGLLGGEDARAYLWQEGIKTYLPLPGTDNEIGGINDEGRVVGTAQFYVTEPAYAFVWFEDELIELPDLDAEDEEAFAINAQGQIVGYAMAVPNSRSARPCLWEPDGQGGYNLTVLEDPYGEDGFATDLNAAGNLIIGHVLVDDTERIRPVVWQWDEGLGRYVIHRVDPYDENNINDYLLTGVNNQGWAIGTETGAAALVWDLRTGQRYYLPKLHRPLAWETTATDLNDANQIVGWGFFDSFSHEGLHACIWEASAGYGMVLLEDYLPPRHDWEKLEFAQAINDRGQIVGSGPNSRYIMSGFWLIPVAPTLTLEEPAPGLAGQENTLVVTGAAPGATIDFYYGTTGGGAFVPGCEYAAGESNVALQIQTEALKWAGSALADENGIATLVRLVPDSARSLGPILIQAADSTHCRISQLVVERFE